mmetsp:Transcript_38506/g.75204  ORF Transcript_38506/g.75204 Transcript_38506/m.75204 type:complete len:153 (-) Transcript_38506:89-547(-)
MYSAAIAQICLVFLGAVSVCGQKCSIKPGRGGVFRVPDETTSINAMTFYGCNDIVKIFIHKRVTKIEPRAFGKAPNLKTVTFEKGSLLTEIGKLAFALTKLKTINIPLGIEKIGQEAFYDTGCDEKSFTPGAIVFDCIYETRDTVGDTIPEV